MKAFLDNENMKIIFDNEAIKAIRFVRGLNTDLRVSLDTIHKDGLWYWLDNNGVKLFGFKYAACRKQWNDPDFDKFESMLNDAVKQIAR